MHFRFLQMPALVVGLMALSVPLAWATGFVDVFDGYPGKEAMESLRDQSIMKGFLDGSFHPDQTMSRAELIKVIVSAKLDPKGMETCEQDADIFSDISRGAWFALPVCIAKTHGIIRGFSDGTFHPGDIVTVGEAAMILGRAYGMEEESGKPWYKPGIEFLASKGALPASVTHANQEVTRSELAQIIAHLQEGAGGSQSGRVASMLSATCDEREDAIVPKVDLAEVRRQWLQWVNALRTKRGLTAVASDRHLQRTANMWSKNAAAKGSMSHKRPDQTAYYDYKKMVSWFENLGLEFKNMKSTTFTENIGWGYYDCTQSDCTEEFTEAIRTTFDMYLREESTGGPHWQSLLNPQFRLAGIGIAVKRATKQYFLTLHYATDITSNPDPVCP